MTDEIKEKIEEYKDVLLNQQFTHYTVKAYMAIVRDLYKSYDDITPENIKLYCCGKDMKNSRQKHRVLYKFKRWLDDGIIPIKEKGKDRSGEYRPECKRDCEYSRNCMCTYREGVPLFERIKPQNCSYYKAYVPRNLKRKNKYGENGCKIIYKDAHSIMYGLPEDE